MHRAEKRCFRVVDAWATGLSSWGLVASLIRGTVVKVWRVAVVPPEAVSGHSRSPLLKSSWLQVDHVLDGYGEAWNDGYMPSPRCWRWRLRALVRRCRLRGDGRRVRCPGHQGVVSSATSSRIQDCTTGVEWRHMACPWPGMDTRYMAYAAWR